MNLFDYVIKFYQKLKPKDKRLFLAKNEKFEEFQKNVLKNYNDVNLLNASERFIDERKKEFAQILIDIWVNKNLIN